jgi:IS30 family transposase
MGASANPLPSSRSKNSVLNWSGRGYKAERLSSAPQSPWQRGTNENTNGLLRQYLPKKTDLSGYSQSHLDKSSAALKSTPAKNLGLRNFCE